MWLGCLDSECTGLGRCSAGLSTEHTHGGRLFRSLYPGCSRGLARMTLTTLAATAFGLELRALVRTFLSFRGAPVHQDVGG